jgi:hypothetical protein
MGGNGAGQGGTPEPSEGGQAVGGNTAAGDGGSASAGAPDNGQGGDQATGRVDCGGQSCDRCCYEMLNHQVTPEFECVLNNKPPVLCGIDYRFDMTCDSKSDCPEDRFCCMERGTVAMTASAMCLQKCPDIHKPYFYYELCANDEECTAPKQCVKRADLYFRVCQ